MNLALKVVAVPVDIQDLPSPKLAHEISIDTFKYITNFRQVFVSTTTQSSKADPSNFTSTSGS